MGSNKPVERASAPVLVSSGGEGAVSSIAQTNISTITVLHIRSGTDRSVFFFFSSSSSLYVCTDFFISISVYSLRFLSPH